MRLTLISYLDFIKEKLVGEKAPNAVDSLCFFLILAADDTQPVYIPCFLRAD